MQNSRHGRTLALAGTLVLLAACGGERTTAPAAQVQAFGGGMSNVGGAVVGAVTPATATVVAGAAQQFTAWNTAITPNVSLNGFATWSVSGGGTIDANGLFTAGTTPGDAGTWTVTATFGTTATASVTVTSSTPTPTCTADDDHRGKCETVENEDRDNDHRDNHDGKDERGKKHDKDKKNNKDNGHDN